MTLALKSWIEPESPGLKVPFYGSTDCSGPSVQLGNAWLARGHSGRGQKKWTQVPKSGGGISFVIGSRENCWKTAVEAYFWKVFKNVWPKVTLLRKPLLRKPYSENPKRMNWWKLWKIMVWGGVENFETQSPNGLHDIKCGWSKEKTVVCKLPTWCSLSRDTNGQLWLVDETLIPRGQLVKSGRLNC